MLGRLLIFVLCISVNDLLLEIAVYSMSSVVV